MTRNGFRYDTNADGIVTYDELTDFFVELHLGEMSLQRRHMRNLYVRGREYIMNVQEFGATINDFLARINLQASKEQIQGWFRVVDKNCKDWIDYRTYFLFLRFYFGHQYVQDKK